MRKHVHVVRTDNGWGWRTEGASRLAQITHTQAEAIDAARPAAIRNRAELRIHDRNGRIREAWSYGNDPRDIPG